MPETTGITTTGENKDRTIFVLFIPGGAMLGIIPAVVLSRLEELTDTPASHLFQVIDGVSTGSIVTAGLNVRNPHNGAWPKVMSKNTLKHFCEDGPRFFPPMPGRYFRMLATNALNVIEDLLDPLRLDAPLIRKMKLSCDEMRKKVRPEDRPLIDKLQAAVTTRWLTEARKKKVMHEIDALRQDMPEIGDHLTSVNQRFFRRPHNGRMAGLFRWAALGGLQTMHELRKIAADLGKAAEDRFDPLQADAVVIDKMKEFLAEARRHAKPENYARLDALQTSVTARWLTTAARKAAVAEIEAMRTEVPEIAGPLKTVHDLFVHRSQSDMLTRVFCRKAIGGLQLMRRLWTQDYFYDAGVPRQTFQDLFGENMRMSDCLRSTYISACNIKDGKEYSFFCRKEDFFSTDPATPSVTSPGNPRLWDVVMASIANPFAFPPHMTETGILCSDKAFVHTPIRCVEDVLAHKPADAKVALVVFGTGQYLTEKNDREDNDLRDEYVRYGVLGNLIRGQEMLELESYVMSQSVDSLLPKLGADNIIQFLPQLAPENPEEMDSMPSKDILDASDENIEKILKLSEDFIIKEDASLRALARRMVENLHNIGQMDDKRFRSVMRRIDNASKPSISSLYSPPGSALDRMIDAAPGLRSVLTTMAHVMGYESRVANDDEFLTQHKIGIPPPRKLIP